jgi:hypothetical protein
MAIWVIGVLREVHRDSRTSAPSNIARCGDDKSDGKGGTRGQASIMVKRAGLMEANNV